MLRRPTPTRRWLTAATWPLGIALTSWDYMWRSTVLHRSERLEAYDHGHLPPEFPDDVDSGEVLAGRRGLQRPLAPHRLVNLLPPGDV